MGKRSGRHNQARRAGPCEFCGAVADEGCTFTRPDGTSYTSRMVHPVRLLKLDCPAHPGTPVITKLTCRICSVCRRVVG